jgi:hypothetical protein
MVSNSLDLNDDKKTAATSTSSSHKVSKAKVNLKFINENVNQIVGSGGGELDDHYTSVSSSSSSTTSINRINNENNLSNFRRLTSVDDSNKRMAIDLSNDPDLRKYFDNNDVNNEENSSHDNNNATVFNLIDISEPTTTTDSINTNSPSSSSQLNNKNEDENPFGMDRFIDQIIIDTKQASPVPVVSNATTHVHPQTTSNMILSPTSVPKKETPSKPATYKSIIDEFDPIASKLDDLSISSTNNQQTPAAPTTANTTTPALLAASKPYMSKPLLPNSYQNLTARPFNSNNNFSLNQTRPNYNIHIPSSTSVQSFSNHHATPIKPATQPIISSSQSFTNNNNNTNLNKTNFINPFCPTPYHAFNINNHEQTYRPVQFMNSNLNKMTTPSANLFMQSSTSSSLQQQQKQTQNNNTTSNKTTADQLLN